MEVGIDRSAEEATRPDLETLRWHRTSYRSLTMERRPIQSGAQILRFVTDRRPAHAGVDPYKYYIDRNSGDNVLRFADPE